MSRSENMRRIRSKNTSPELIVRRLIYSMGYRYRLHKKDLPGKPDIVFLSRKAVIFIHGCFWHQHPEPSCKSTHIPKSNQDYWGPKLESNIERDKTHLEALNRLGWRVLVLWECEISDTLMIAEKIKKFLDWHPVELSD